MLICDQGPWGDEALNLEVFAWPLAVTVIAVIAMLLFWKPIARFLDRAKKIGTTGIEAAGAGAQDTSKSEVGPSVANDLARQHDDPLLVKREDSIRTELGLGADHTPKETKLLGMIAAQAIALQFRKYVSNHFWESTERPSHHKRGTTGWGSVWGHRKPLQPSGSTAQRMVRELQF